MLKKIVTKLIVLMIVIGGTIACSPKGDTNMPTIQDNGELNKEPEAKEKVPVQKIDNYVASEEELKHFVLARNILNGQDEHNGYKIKKRSKEEEERYIKHFYGDKGLKLDEEQWRSHEKADLEFNG